MLGLGALGQYPLGGGPLGTVTTESIGWYVQPSEPARSRLRLNTGAQQFSAFDTQPFVSFSWFAALSEPARRLPRSPAAQAPSFFYQPMPSPFVPTGWFQALSEPPRRLPRSPAAQAPFFFYQPMPSPFVPTGWFMALSEPARTRPGLKAMLQQFLAAPSQLRPTPTTTGVLNALETKDTFLAGVSVWNRVVTGEIGTSEFKSPSAEIGAGVTAVAGARISVYTIN